MNDIVRNAEGDSVTKDNITGSSRYYPDSSFLFEEDPAFIDDQPHYIVLLTSHDAVALGNPSPTDERGIEYDMDNGCLIIGEKAAYVVSDKFGGMFSNAQGHIELPYNSIDSIGGYGLANGGSITLRTSAIEYELSLANKYGDSENVRSAFRHIHDRLH